MRSVAMLHTCFILTEQTAESICLKDENMVTPRPSLARALDGGT
jgi:hypothetical protein